MVNTLFFGTPALRKGIPCASPATAAAGVPLTFQVANRRKPSRSGAGVNRRVATDKRHRDRAEVRSAPQTSPDQLRSDARPPQRLRSSSVGRSQTAARAVSECRCESETDDRAVVRVCGACPRKVASGRCLGAHRTGLHMPALRQLTAQANCRMLARCHPSTRVHRWSSPV